MPACPNGHQSNADDYCDVCGIAIEQGASVSPAPAVSSQPTPLTPVAPDAPAAAPSVAPAAVPTVSGSAEGEPCPRCRAPRTDRFCEDCGYDFVTGTGMPALGSEPGTLPESSLEQPSDPETDEDVEIPAGTWVAVITADRAYYQRVIAQGGPDAVSLRFPPYALERRLILTGDQVRIGRRSVSQGQTPEIDLGQAPEDPGVSHLHAVLLARPGGSWTLVDPGSTNGTTLNEAADPIEVNTEIPLKHGDRIYVGAWTSITLTKEV